MVTPSQQIVRDWLARAREDLDGASRSLQAPVLPGLVAFLARQAFEKSLKAYLIWHGVVFPKTHNLLALNQLCEPIHPGFQALRTAAQLISQYATSPRYPDMGPEPTDAEAAGAFQQAQAAYAFVLQRRLPPEVRP